MVAEALEWEGERVGIWLCMSEYAVWVVAEVLALVLEWKGGRGWGYGCACPNTQCGWWLRHWYWNEKGERVGIQLCMSKYAG